MNDVYSMAESAVALHELYLSYLDAGFTEGQAFELVMVALGSSIQKEGS